MKFLQFYRECFVRAFSGKFLLAESWTAAVGIIVFLISKIEIVPEDIRSMLNDDIPMYFFVVVFIVIVAFGLVTAPHKIYLAELSKSTALSKAREPKIKVSLRDVEGTAEDRGFTVQTQGGNRYTQLHSSTSNAVSLMVQNVGETRIEKCTASLIWFECVDGEGIGPRTLIEPIMLPWSHIDVEQHLEKSLDPGTTARVWIADVNYKGWTWLMREARKLPADCQQIFGPSGRYRAIIKVTDGQSLSIETCIEIVGSESEATDIYPNGTGRSSIAILEQKSPKM